MDADTNPDTTGGGRAAGTPEDGHDAPGDHGEESYNPWTIVNIVFAHLADEGLHPVLGDHGDPGEHARALLLALGIRPMAEGNREVMKRVHEHLAEIRSVMFENE